MRHSSFLLLAAIAASALAANGAYATPVGPTTTDSVGTVSPASFFGNPGHPDANNFQIETVTQGSNTLTLALRIEQRGVGSITPNAGTDVYPVQPGYQPGHAPGSASVRSYWNFDYYVFDSNGTVANTNLSVTINGVSASDGNIALATSGVAGNNKIEGDDVVSAGQTLENSEQYGFFTAPGVYNPLSVDNYNFTISATDSSTGLSATTNAVASVVPEPASLGLLGAGALALLARRRRLA